MYFRITTCLIVAGQFRDFKCYKMADQQQLLQHLIKSAIEEVKKTLIFKEEDLRDTLPDGYTYNIESLSSEPSKFKARLVSEDITTSNMRFFKRRTSNFRLRLGYS